MMDKATNGMTKVRETIRAVAMISLARVSSRSTWLELQTLKKDPEKRKNQEFIFRSRVAQEAMANGWG